MKFPRLLCKKRAFICSSIHTSRTCLSSFILTAAVLWLFLVKSEKGHCQLGLNYEASSGFEQYNSIRNLPGTVCLTDSTQLANGSDGCCGGVYNSILLNYGTLPFHFKFNGQNANAFHVTPGKGELKFTNGGIIKAGNFVGAAVQAARTVNNVNTPIMGLEVGNYAYGAWGVINGNVVTAQIISMSDYNSVDSIFQDVEFNIPFNSGSGGPWVFYTTGRVYFNVIGEAPNRRAIVEWFAFHESENGNVGGAGGGQSGLVLYNFQIELHESSYEICIHFGKSKTSLNSNLGGSTFVGLLNSLDEFDNNCFEGNSGEMNHHTQYDVMSINGGGGDTTSGFRHQQNFQICWQPLNNSDSDNDGFTETNGDCDDNNPEIGPYSNELCNAIDDNCNNQIDEGFDIDLDGYTSCAGDCDDNDPVVFPGANELADSIDNNCDALIDENFNTDTNHFFTKPISYQAVARDAQGAPLSNTTVQVQFTLLADSLSGAQEYSETHALTTNNIGLFTTAFGAGTALSGTYADINWSGGNKFLNVQLDTGTGLVDMGTQQLLSTPYSMHSATSGAIKNPGLPVFTDNDAALAGGLIAGDMYRTASGNLMVVY
jgi:hypothetical protein